VNRLQQAFVWLRRISHCRGFGIQSPSDYRFVRYVINERWPYYAYAALGRHDGWLRKKKGRLFFRLANDLQPDNVVDLLGYEEYLKAGCQKATLTTHLSPLTSHLIIAPPNADLQTICQTCDDHTLLVVDDIGQHAKVWEEILATDRVTVTFDLYYCGIVLFDPQRARQHYIVNF